MRRFIHQVSPRNLPALMAAGGPSSMPPTNFSIGRLVKALAALD